MADSPSPAFGAKYRVAEVVAGPLEVVMELPATVTVVVVETVIVSSTTYAMFRPASTFTGCFPGSSVRTVDDCVTTAVVAFGVVTCSVTVVNSVYCLPGTIFPGKTTSVGEKVVTSGWRHGSRSGKRLH
jgi:hypothetical protein